MYLSCSLMSGYENVKLLLQGDKGDTGEAGSPGPVGPRGPPGRQGDIGYPGYPVSSFELGIINFFQWHL